VTKPIKRGSKVRVIEAHTTQYGNTIPVGAEGQVSLSIAGYESDCRTYINLWIQFPRKSGAWIPNTKLEAI
jgi:hypothetical protein